VRVAGGPRGAVTRSLPVRARRFIESHDRRFTSSKQDVSCSAFTAPSGRLPPRRLVRAARALAGKGEPVEAPVPAEKPSAGPGGTRPLEARQNRLGLGRLSRVAAPCHLLLGCLAAARDSSPSGGLPRTFGGPGGVLPSPGSFAAAGWSFLDVWRVDSATPSPLTAGRSHQLHGLSSAFPVPPGDARPGTPAR